MTATATPRPVHGWTAEKLSGLSSGELGALRANAAARDAGDLVAMCDAEIARRGSTTPKRTRIRRALPIRELERLGAASLVTLADHLSSRFDLSEETARRLHQGVKGFRPHGLSGRNGDAKVGGDQMNGTVALYRYLSYRAGDIVVSIALFLENGHPAERAVWLVRAPPALIPGWKTMKEVGAEIITLAGDERGGVAFGAFTEAAELFEELIGKVAPARPNQPGRD